MDYGVGPDAATSFVAWTTLSGTGITVGSNFVEFSGVASPVISGVDFTTGGGAYLLLPGAPQTPR